MVKTPSSRSPLSKPSLRLLLVLISVGLLIVVRENGLNLVAWEFRAGEPRLLYVAKDDADNDQIYMIRQSGGEPAQLTSAPYGIYDYSLSPDTSLIVYSALRDDGGSDLRAVSSDGSEEHLLLACPEEVCSGAAWRPNSQSLIYERRTMLAPGAAPGSPRLWWLDLANNETVPVFDDTQILGYGPGWSPDGEWLSYVAPSSQGVQVYNVSSGRDFLIPSRMGGLAVWSPGGDELLVSDIQHTTDGFTVHLLKAATETGELIDVTGEGQNVEDSSPAWSPDQSWIAITRKAAGASMGKQIWLMRPDGSDAQGLTDETEIHHGLPVWSPDGRYIAFQRFPLRELNAMPGIWIIEVETGKTWEVITPGNRPMWLP